jgi:hypothetical protein
VHAPTANPVQDQITAESLLVGISIVIQAPCLYIRLNYLDKLSVAASCIGSLSAKAGQSQHTFDISRSSLLAFALLESDATTFSIDCRGGGVCVCSACARITTCAAPLRVSACKWSHCEAGQGLAPTLPPTRRDVLALHLITLLATYLLLDKPARQQT